MEKFFYRVQSGDSILSLCQRFNCSMGKLISLNGLVREIRAGDILFVEREKQVYMVKPTDTLNSIAKKFCVLPQSILEKNRIPYIFCGLIIAI